MRKLNKLSEIAAKKLKESGTLAYDNMIIKELQKFSNEELIEIGVLRMTKEDLYECLNNISNYADKVKSRLYTTKIDDEKLIKNINNIYDTVNSLLCTLSE